MVAPNGARRTKGDHPHIPVTIDEIVDTARQCFDAGAGAIHAHVRDEDQNHVLDAGLYRELIGELGAQVPHMQVQITTEAVGRYSNQQQSQVVQTVLPKYVSVSLMEMTGGNITNTENDNAIARRFYHWAFEADIHVQHILYSADEINFLQHCIKAGIVPETLPLEVLFVLGRYSVDQQSDIRDLDGFIDRLELCFPNSQEAPIWAVCAFGVAESECLIGAAKRGGKMRIGFENSLWHSDGRLAQNNAERVDALVKALKLIDELPRK